MADIIHFHRVSHRYGDGPEIISDVSFTLGQGEMAFLTGPSGAGKSTLLRLTALLARATRGQVLVGGQNLAEIKRRNVPAFRRQIGVIFQNPSLLTERTVFENVALPLQLYTRINAVEVRALVRYKLGLVGLRGYEEFYPSEISGGMRKRAGLARALALDPEMLFLDEPSAGLDPISSRRLDDLILQLRDGTGASIVVVSHELPSLFAIGDDGIFLDGDSKRPIAHGSPKYLLQHSDHPRVQAFLRREPVQDEGTHHPVVHHDEDSPGDAS